jgi:hypothetical protein
MEDVNLVDLNLDKKYFRICRANRKGEYTTNRKPSRKQILIYVTNS